MFSQVWHNHERVCVCNCLCVSEGGVLGWTVEGWSASNPWEWNAFPFVALQFLTGLPQHMSMMGLFLLSSFPDPLLSNPVLPVPKAIGIPGGHQWSSFRGKARWLLGGLLCTGSKGRRQCLINWLGVLGRVEEFAEGGDRKVGMRDELRGMEGRDNRERLMVHQWRFINLCLRFISVWFTLLLGRRELWRCRCSNWGMGSVVNIWNKYFLRILLSQPTLLGPAV